MPPRIIPILGRLRQDIAASLSPEIIAEACAQVGHTWRKRLLDPATTLYLFLLQVLHGNTACQHVVHFGGWAFSDSAYCQARKRLPLAVSQWLLEKVAALFRSATAGDSRWLGHRVWLVDGSSFSMPDEPELQRHFGQSGKQKKGCGFPVARWLALFDLSTGMLLRAAPAPLRTHEMWLSAAISGGWSPATSCWGTGDSAPMPTWPCCRGAVCTGCSGSIRSSSSTSPPGAPRRRAGRGTWRACRARGGCWRRANATRWWSGTSPRVSHRG